VSRLVGALRDRSRRNDGAVSLELMISFFVWFASVLIFLNMFFLLGTSMMVQTALGRTAQQTAALGCLSQAVHDDFVTRQTGLGAHSFELVARTPMVSPDSYIFDRGSVVADDGGLQGQDASCDIADGLNAQRDQSSVVTNGEYIWLRVRYQQRIIFAPGFSPDVQMQRSALVISQSLHSDPPGATKP
jgi:hypothetical protein